jgi:FkbM family methyltransferase
LALNVGNRSMGAVLRAPFRGGHYRAFANMVRLYPRFPDNLHRFLRAKGDYPYECAVRTPVGVVRPTLYTSHDLSTMNEVFCRLDYRADERLGTVVDVGSNIGISALYFLTRNHSSRCYLFEPDPRNVERLKANLAGYEDRYVLDASAVGTSNGRVSFGIESTGRYGGIDVSAEETITVDCREINEVLEEVLAREELIDVLKVDTEGLEIDTVGAIRPDLLDRIKTIYFEADWAEPLHETRFDHAYSCQTNRLVNRALASSA